MDTAKLSELRSRLNQMDAFDAEAVRDALLELCDLLSDAQRPPAGDPGRALQLAEAAESEGDAVQRRYDAEPQNIPIYLAEIAAANYQQVAALNRISAVLFTSLERGV